MKNVLIFGIYGKMGLRLIDAIEKDDSLRIAAGVDVKSGKIGDVNVYSDVSSVTENIDVIIDFSRPSSLDPILSFALGKNIPAVLCTTGYSEEEFLKIDEAAKSVPVFVSANMSQGISLLAKLSKIAANTLDGFDIEIVEAHHNKKVDAPSGTAVLLANEIIGEKSELFIDTNRMNEKKARNKNEIGISSVRGGSIVGEHEVMFIGENEIVTIKHSALSRSVFADGAVKAAKFVLGKSSGKYDMQDITG